MSMRMPAVWTILSSFVRKVVHQRYLISNFVSRDLKTRYVGSFIGLFWAVIHPLVLLICYSVVFSKALGIKVTKFPQIDNNFAVFLFSGLLPWLYFQDTLQRGCDSVVNNANLIRKTAFPSEILPVVIAASNLATHLIGLAILVVVLLYFGTLGSAMAVLPLYILLTAVLALGLGWLLAPLQVFVRDTSQVLTVAVTFWFWFTPIFYRAEDLPRNFQVWMSLNPMRHVVDGYRAILLDNRLPDAQSFAILGLWAAAAFALGGLVFRNIKRDFVDVL